MTESMYRAIWVDTNKAMQYLYKKGCCSICTSVPSGFGKAHLLTYKVSDTDEKMQNHVRKKYPNAAIEFVDRDTVVQEQLTRDIAFAEYRKTL